MATELSTKDFEEKIQEGVTLVDFHAPWCGPCQMMSPVIDELSSEYEGRANIYKVNVDNEPDLANRFQVMSIPTIIVFKDGKAVDQTLGAQGKDKLKDMIDKNL